MDPIIIWDLDDDPEGNYAHILEHGVSQEEVEDVLLNRRNPTTASRSTARHMTFGWTHTERHIAVVWELVDEDPRTIMPVTAYETPPRMGKR